MQRVQYEYKALVWFWYYDRESVDEFLVTQFSTRNCEAQNLT